MVCAGFGAEIAISLLLNLIAFVGVNNKARPSEFWMDAPFLLVIYVVTTFGRIGLIFYLTRTNTE